MVKIHPTAIVDPGAELGEDVEIGPFCIVEDQTALGARTVLQARSMVRRWTSLGTDNLLLPGVVLGGDPQHLDYRGQRTDLRIGNRNRFGEYVTIHRASREDSVTVVGDDNYLMGYCHIGHDCRVGNRIVMTNYAGLAGWGTVEDCVLMAAFSGTHQGVRVGTMAMLGAGALAGQDVAPYVIVQGVPARPRGLNAIGMQRRGVGEEARRALKMAYRFLFQMHLSLPSALEKIRDEVPDLSEIRHLLEFIEHSKRGLARRIDS